MARKKSAVRVENEEQRRVRLRKAAVLQALKDSLGIVTQACEAVGIGRTTFYRWCKEDPGFQSDVDDISEIALDFVESKLLNQIQGGNTAATIFYLKCKGKGRGYIEVGTEGPGSGPGIDFNKLLLREDDRRASVAGLLMRSDRLTPEEEAQILDDDDD